MFCRMPLGVCLKNEESLSSMLYRYVPRRESVWQDIKHVLPGEYLKVFDHASNHDVERARQAQERILKVLQLMDLLEGSFTRKALGLFKILLWHLGVIHSYTLTAPLEPLNNSEVNRLVQKAREIGFSCLS